VKAHLSMAERFPALVWMLRILVYKPRLVLSESRRRSRDARRVVTAHRGDSDLKVASPQIDRPHGDERPSDQLK
jgi:hypothetical protein